MSISSTLSAERVREIRERLGLTVEELASLLDVSTSIIKKWERPSADRECRGPAGLLLQLLERDAGVLNLLSLDPIASPPSPSAERGTQEWLRLQRLLGILSVCNHDYSTWCQVLEEENVQPAWLHAAAYAGWVSPKRSSNAGIYNVTETARLRFKLRQWVSWLTREHRGEDTAHLPLMTYAELERDSG